MMSTIRDMRQGVSSTIGILNVVLLGIIAVILIGSYLVHGMFGVYCWVILKFIVPFVGLFLLIVDLISIVRSRHDGIGAPKILTLVISVAFIFPILMTMGIIPVAYPVDIDAESPSITVHSPFEDSVVIGWGGDSVEDNKYHVQWPSERWAYDIVNTPYNDGSTDLTHYGIWNTPVYAPCSGIVVIVRDGEVDMTPGDDESRTSEGNCVYIQVDETGTYMLLAHLKNGSVAVHEGQHVDTSTLIGNVGNSGSSSEPHLHIHHQRQDPRTTLSPILAEGLPLYFFNGSGDSHMPVRGMTLAGYAR